MKTQTLKWWIYGAVSVPSVCLMIVFITYYVGWDDWLHTIMSLILVGFTSVCVYWWWFIIFKLKWFYDFFEETEKNFMDIKQEIKNIKKSLTK